MTAGRRWIASTLVLAVLAACGGEGDDDELTEVEEGREIELELSSDALRDGVVDIDAQERCVLDEGVAVARAQLEAGECSLVGRPRSVRPAKHPRACADGSELWVAGRDGEDKGGGWTNLDADGEGRWTRGAYADAAASCG